MANPTEIFSDSIATSDEINESIKRFTNQLLTIKLETTFDTKPINDYFADPDMITEDMLTIGTLNYPYLRITIPEIIDMDINLTISLQQSIIQRKFKLVELLIDYDIDIFKLEPNIMGIVATMLDDRLVIILNKFIDLKIPVYPNNYACIYILASKGQLDLLVRIISSYTFNNMMEIVGKICAVAVRTDHVTILEHFMPVQTFDTIPDIIFEYLIKGIECGDNIKVIKYFTQTCIQISQENYRAVTIARQFKRKKILQYFVASDPHVITLLDQSEITEYEIIN